MDNRAPEIMSPHFWDHLSHCRHLQRVACQPLAPTGHWHDFGRQGDNETLAFHLLQPGEVQMRP